MNICKNTLVFCCLMLFVACAAKPIATNTPPQRDESIKLIMPKQSYASELLLFCESYSKLTLDGQKKHFSESSLAVTKNKNDLFHRIKLGIMLALPGSKLRDPNKAQNMLQALVQENTLEETDAALVNMMYEYTLLDNKQSSKIHEDNKKLETAQQRYLQLEQKHDALAQKLNDLKNIEKALKRP